MKYINLMGSISDLDRVVEMYISKAEIQLEYTSKELVAGKDLMPFLYINPYAGVLKTAERIYKMSGFQALPKTDINKDVAINYINAVSVKIDELSNELNRLRQKRDSYVYIIETMKPFSDLDFDIRAIKDFEYIKYNFGKMPYVSFKQFEAYIYHNPEILFEFGRNDKEYIWGVYFVSDFSVDKVDSVFSSLHFEKIDIPMSIEGEDLHGSPMSICNKYVQKLAVIEAEISEKEKIMMAKADNDVNNIIDKQKIAEAYVKISEMHRNHDIRKFAAKTRNEYYIFVGWMTENEAKRFQNQVSEDEKVVFIIEEDNDAIVSIPPTKLKNSPLVRPFEFFVKMYGLPTYGEIEPTSFIALTYTLLFGIMFGDIGQGAVISILGLFLSRVKKMALGSIMFIIGISAMIFGVLFGSVFGVEITPLLLNPGHPDNINTLLIGAIAIGVTLVVTTMIFNIVSSLKRGKKIEVLFDPNGFAGLTLYGSVIAIALLVLFKGISVPFVAIIVLVAILLLIGLRHILVDRIKGHKAKHKESIGILAFETFIEMFETVLSYFTNTVSFVRVGAFALSHASLMGVVRMLAGEETGALSIPVMIAGNIIVLGLEGLIVGIQVLRIEFYEVFSRFYEGKGREFIPFKKNVK